MWLLIFGRAIWRQAVKVHSLVPVFHSEQFYSSQENRAVLNIGGIANLTLLPKQGRLVALIVVLVIFY